MNREQLEGLSREALIALLLNDRQLAHMGRADLLAELRDVLRKHQIHGRARSNEDLLLSAGGLLVEAPQGVVVVSQWWVDFRPSEPRVVWLERGEGGQLSEEAVLRAMCEQCRDPHAYAEWRNEQRAILRSSGVAL